MEESDNSKRFREGNGKEGTDLKKVKLESDNKKEVEYNESHDKIELQKDIGIMNETKTKANVIEVKSEQSDKQYGESSARSDKIIHQKVIGIKKENENEANVTIVNSESNAVTESNEGNESYEGNGVNVSYEGNEVNESTEGNESYEDNESHEGNEGNESTQGNEGNESNENNESNARKDEESHIFELFKRVLDTVLHRKGVNPDDVAQSITEIIESHINTANLRCGAFHDIDFTKWEYICGYLYRYTSHGAGFTRFLTLQAIQNCAPVKEVLKKPNLNIICLGSGPGNDFVGLCSALSELQYPKTLKMTLVDKFKEWMFCIGLAKQYVEEGDYGKVSEFFRRTNAELRFIQAELPGDLESDKEYFKFLAEADVIVMTKLVTILDRANWSESEKAITRSLHKHTKENVIILLNDVYYANLWRGFHLLYCFERPEEERYYTSTALVKDKDIRFNSNDYVSSKLTLHVLIKESFQNKMEKK